MTSHNDEITQSTTVISTCIRIVTDLHHNQVHTYIRVSFRGGGKCRPLDHKCPPLEFEKAKMLDMSNTSVKSQETLVVSLGKHDITNSKNRHF